MTNEQWQQAPTEPCSPCRPPPPTPAHAPACPQDFASALPATGGGPKAASASTGGHVERYAALCEQLYRLSLQLHTAGPPGAAPDAALKGSAKAGGGPSAARDRWRRAVQRQCEINAAKKGGPAAAGAVASLVGGMLQRGDAQQARWCGTLLLLQQLGVGLWRLQDCLGERSRAKAGARQL
jgi:hypothetical protein